MTTHTAEKVECKLMGICYCYECKEKRKADCMDHYSTREAKLFKQYDGFLDCDQLDDLMKGDEDRDCLMGNSGTWELMHGASVRVLNSHDIISSYRWNSLRVLQTGII